MRTGRGWVFLQADLFDTGKHRPVWMGLLHPPVLWLCAERESTGGGVLRLNLSSLLLLLLILWLCVRSTRTRWRTSWTSGTSSATDCSAKPVCCTAATTLRTSRSWAGPSSRSSSSTTLPPPTCSTPPTL